MEKSTKYAEGITVVNAAGPPENNLIYFFCSDCGLKREIKKENGVLGYFKCECGTRYYYCRKCEEFHHEESRWTWFFYLRGCPYDIGTKKYSPPE